MPAKPRPIRVGALIGSSLLSVGVGFVGAMLAAASAAPAAAAPPGFQMPEVSVPPAPSGARATDQSEIYRGIARLEAEKLGVPYPLIDAVMRVESAYDPRAIGAAGEIGLMQIMPPTARLLGHKGDDRDLAVPQTNIHLGARYLAGAWRLAKQDICTAVMKYRAGHNETRFSALSVRYCIRVRAHLASLGYPLTGVVPEPTFGFRADTTRMGIAIGTQQAARRLATGRKLRSRVNWAAHDARMKLLTARGRTGLGL